jgi:hypothetical protein
MGRYVCLLFSPNCLRCRILRLMSDRIPGLFCSDDPSVYPEMRLMTSTGLPANGDPGNEEAREPKGDELMFITPGQARKKWEDRVWEMVQEPAG